MYAGLSARWLACAAPSGAQAGVLGQPNRLVVGGGAPENCWRVIGWPRGFRPQAHAHGAQVEKAQGGLGR
jgi:hypothetical protein